METARTDQPGPNTATWMERKKNAVAQGVASLPVVVERAQGALITDVDGNTYIDFYGGIGALNAGHCPPEVVEAVRRQAGWLLHSCFSISMYKPYIELAEILNSLFQNSAAAKAIFVNSGAEAAENAIKIARAATKRPGIIAFQGAFHGRTLLAMTLTSKVKPYKYGFGPFAPEVYSVPYAYCYRCSFNSSYPGCGLHCLEHFGRFFAAQAAPENIAAMIVEPVQGEGGFVVPPPEFLPGLQSICEQNDILLIIDEVQTGFCRTGQMFAFQNWDVAPDIITVAKSIAAGLPLGGVIGKAEIMDKPEPGQLGSTFGGNPLACSAALATLHYLQENALAERAVAIGARVMDKLKDLQERYDFIGDVRGIGAMTAMEIVEDRQSKIPAPVLTSKIIKSCQSRGLLIINAGIFSNVIRMLMPLTISYDDLQNGLEILEEAVSDQANNI